MRKWGILALIGAGVGFFLGTERGRSCLNQAGQLLQEGYGRLGGQLSASGDVQELVHDALATPHEDTPVARAFEEACA